MSDLPLSDSAESSLFDVVRLAECLGDSACRLDVEAVAECGSTNAELLQKISANAASGSVLVADVQTAGRGRRGRRWWSAQHEPADSLTFSLLWRFPRGAPLSGLSLAVGVALAQALAEVGAGGVKLKWPNDLLIDSPAGLAKIGGILIELSSGAGGTAAVIGVGLNLKAPRETLPDQLAGGIDALLPGGLPERHRLFAAILRQLVATLDLFTARGFAALRADWEGRNAYAGREVRLIEESGAAVAGSCLGVDDDGALRVATADGVRRWLAGDVTLRPAAGGA